MLILTDGLSRAFRPAEAALAIAVWVSTAFQPPFVFHAAIVTPLIVAVFMVRVLVGNQRKQAVLF
jgi:cytochrome c oxidase subunit IV